MTGEWKVESENEQAFDRIRLLISQVCAVDPGKVSKNARLLAFGIDSVRVLELLLSVEEEFEICLEPAELNDIATVGQLVSYVERLRTLKQAG